MEMWKPNECGFRKILSAEKGTIVVPINQRGKWAIKRDVCDRQ